MFFKISLKFVPVMAWHWTCDEPLPKRTMSQFTWVCMHYRALINYMYINHSCNRGLNYFNKTKYFFTKLSIDHSSPFVLLMCYVFMEPQLKWYLLSWIYRRLVICSLPVKIIWNWQMVFNSWKMRIVTANMSLVHDMPHTETKASATNFRVRVLGCCTYLTSRPPFY